MVDEKTVLDALQGKESAFALIYDETVKKAYTTAYSIVKDENDAWDVVQESYLRMWQTLEELKDPSKLELWFYEIVRTRALAFLQIKDVKQFVISTDIMSAVEE